ncbi:MAG: hypothetical protein ACE5G1_14055 [bacterium]
MTFNKKRIQLLAISPEDGVAFAKYKNNGIYAIGPPFFNIRAVKNWEAILSRLEDYFKEEELVDFQSSFNSWDELAKYLRELFVENSKHLLEKA